MVQTVFTRFCTIYDSSNISKVSYDPKGQRLGVTFRQLDTTEIQYVYDNVPIEIFGMILSAESVGKEFKKHNLVGARV